MPYEDPTRHLSIDVSVALQIAAQLAIAEGDEPTNTFMAIAPSVVDQVLTIKAQKLVEANLPGTTEVPQATYTPPTATVAQAVSAPVVAYIAPAPQPQPAAIPGATDGDPQVAAIWADFFKNPGAFYDNRSSKRNPKAPDFKNKQNGDLALWINDKKNPSWVAQGLAQIGMG